MMMCNYYYSETAQEEIQLFLVINGCNRAKYILSIMRHSTLYQQQQKLRQALEDKIGKEGTQGNAGDLIKKMEEIELDLINKGFTNQTLQNMMDLQHQLLKLDNAAFTQGEEEKRESKTNRKEYNQALNTQIQKAKQYFNTVEILNRQALPLRSQFKKKLQEYFKTVND